MKKDIDNYMSVKEAAYRYDININTLKEKLKGRTKKAEENLAFLTSKGWIKYSTVPGDKMGTWIITTYAMDFWFGEKE